MTDLTEAEMEASKPEIVDEAEYDGEIPSHDTHAEQVAAFNECNHPDTLVHYEDAPVHGGILLCADCGGSI